MKGDADMIQETWVDAEPGNARRANRRSSSGPGRTGGGGSRWEHRRGQGAGYGDARGVDASWRCDRERQRAR